MKRISLLAASLSLFVAQSYCLASQTVQKPGDIVFQTGFEGANALAGWSGSADLDTGYHGGKALCIERLDTSGESRRYTELVFPVEKVRGYVIHCSVMIKAENVSPKPSTWGGIKFMVPNSTPARGWEPQAVIDSGTYGWKKYVFPVTVPKDATKMSIVLGLDNVTGKVWYDDLKIAIHRAPDAASPKAAGRVDNLPRFRGAMTSFVPKEEDIRTIGRDWNANVIRWQINGWSPGTHLTSDSKEIPPCCSIGGEEVGNTFHIRTSAQAYKPQSNDRYYYD